MVEGPPTKRRREDDDEGGRGPAVNDSGGEITMSINETNKLRISLGLKPLNMEAPKAGKPLQEDESRKKREQDKKAEELRHRVESARDKRQLDAKLRAVRTLGEASDGEDDMEAWVERNRRMVEQRQAEAARQKEQAAKKVKTCVRDDSDDEGHNAQELEGMKVRTDVTDLMEGETVIVTLADQAILDERGNLREAEDELENVLQMEQKKRDKARKAAGTKAKPLWEEDGKRRTLLDKYDEQEEELMGVTLGSGGAVEAERMKRLADMRKKLEEGVAALDASGPATLLVGAKADYLSPEEVAALEQAKAKKLRKREKKERKLRAKTPEEEASTAALVEALEAEAALAGSGSDLLRRADRTAARAADAAKAAALQQEKRARFEAAVDKANWASKALKPLQADSAASAPSLGDDEADKELAEMLDRARRAALQRAAEAATKADADASVPDTTALGPSDSLAEVARLAALRRQQDEQRKDGEQQVLTETMEFVRNITVKAPKDEPGTKGRASSAEPPAAAGQRTPGATTHSRAYLDDGSDMDEDAPAPAKERKGAGWVVAKDEAMEAMEGAEGSPAAPQDAPGSSGRESVPVELQDGGVTGERVIGRGLGSVLSVLHDKGALTSTVEWGGRTNDSKKNMVQGLEEVYTGGRSQDRLANSIERALTKRDELGRVLTPKERFRQLCHQFHGIFPSKNQVDKKLRKDTEYLATQKAATSEDPSKELDKLRALQQRSGSAYVVLSGKQVGLPPPAPGGPKLPKRDAEGGRNTVATPLPKGATKGNKHAGAMAPPGPLGNLTPLLGVRKVEAWDASGLKSSLHTQQGPA